MFRVKICGVRTIDDVRAAKEAGADCVGLNFYRSSPRLVDLTFACSLATHVDGIDLVGVFVNEPIDDMLRVAAEAKLDWLQLHGDETLDTAGQLANSGVGLIRAVRLPTSPLSASQIDALVLPWAEAGARILLDADGGAHFGGSGQRLDWDGIGRWAEQTSVENWILAGGLNPENVATAIRCSHATAVDVAGGTEASKGVKDAQRIRQFAANALAALPA